jgi:hypothetical protein
LHLSAAIIRYFGADSAKPHPATTFQSRQPISEKQTVNVH